ncbi:hypothetical protein ABZ892_28205 [Streptomyces sp. NPDC046924]|uniref:hypothetical protein n=1 Tax=Streptomyces sp. NPDC046924 TaxID=3155136 RepID=UPI0033E5726C
MSVLSSVLRSRAAKAPTCGLDTWTGTTTASAAWGPLPVPAARAYAALERAENRTRR